MQATFNYGDPVMLKHTPAGAVSAGDVVVVGDRALIAHRAIAADTLGSLAGGGGVYTVTADAAIAEGKKVYWDNAANKVTETASGNAKFGFVVPGSSSSADGDSIVVHHEPGKTANDNTVLRSDLSQDVLAPFRVPFTDLRVWDAPTTLLPSAGASDDLGHIYNTFLTGAPSVETGDSKAASTTRKAYFAFRVPIEYDAGETITLRLKAGMKTTVSDTTATIDAQVVRDAAPTVDICATAAQSINSLTGANKDFTLTPTNVVPGDLLHVVVTIAIVDGATGTAVIGQLTEISVLMDSKG